MDGETAGRMDERADIQTVKQAYRQTGTQMNPLILRHYVKTAVGATEK